MRVRLFLTRAGIALAAAALAGSPAVGQVRSDGAKFLKAVKDRDGTVATELLNEPGTTVANARDLASGESALHLVVQRRDLTWLRFLLQQGANPNLGDNAGVTPLQVATRLGFIEGLAALVEGGANVDVADTTGETPLIGAVHRRDAEMVKLLLAHGANPLRTDNSGRSARDYALLMGAGNPILAAIEASAKTRQPAAQIYGPR